MIGVPPICISRRSLRFLYPATIISSKSLAVASCRLKGTPRSDKPELNYSAQKVIQRRNRLPESPGYPRVLATRPAKPTVRSIHFARACRMTQFILKFFSPLSQIRIYWKGNSDVSESILGTPDPRTLQPTWRQIISRHPGTFTTTPDFTWATIRGERELE